MLLLMCPLVGYSFVQAVSLYSDASRAALQSPVIATSISPLDGILVPTFGALYVAVTLLFPFVAIRVLGQEKESGALRLLLQLPYRSSTLVIVKLTAILAAWGLVSIPALSSLIIWVLLGGHLAPSETLNLVFGHLLYGLLVGAIALFAATVADSSATAAIIALAVTIGSWVLDFSLAGRSGVAAWIAQLSLTQTLSSFEQGLFSAGLVLGILAVVWGFAALSSAWLPAGRPFRAKLVRSLPCVLATVAVLGIVMQVRKTVDVAEDRRNSFSLADERLLGTLQQPLVVTVKLAAEDPRYVDLQRNVLAKLERAMPHVSVVLASGRQDFATKPDAYGQIEYVYGNRSDSSRSTSPREILPLLYALAGTSPPAPVPAAEEYSGYPLVASADATLVWFLGGLPLLIVFAWWWSRRPPPIRLSRIYEGDEP